MTGLVTVRTPDLAGSAALAVKLITAGLPFATLWVVVPLLSVAVKLAAPATVDVTVMEQRAGFALAAIVQEVADGVPAPVWTKPMVWATVSTVALPLASCSATVTVPVLVPSAITESGVALSRLPLAVLLGGPAMKLTDIGLPLLTAVPLSVAVKLAVPTVADFTVTEQVAGLALAAIVHVGAAGVVVPAPVLVKTIVCATVSVAGLPLASRRVTLIELVAVLSATTLSGLALIRFPFAPLLGEPAV